jgi:WD40 repeat protein
VAAVTDSAKTPKLTGFVVGSRRAPVEFGVEGQSMVLGGFLPDGERFVTVERDRVSIRSFVTGEYLATSKQFAYGLFHSQVSADGRFWGGFGPSSFNCFPLDPLGAPQRFKRTGGERAPIHSFAFHPAAKFLAVIRGGPTLVKMYTVEGLKQTATFNWKVGPLNEVVFSPDGTLAAAGGRDGRIVVWDVDA